MSTYRQRLWKDGKLLPPRVISYNTLQEYQQSINKDISGRIIDSYKESKGRNWKDFEIEITG